MALPSGQLKSLLGSETRTWPATGRSSTPWPRASPTPPTRCTSAASTPRATAGQPLFTYRAGNEAGSLAVNPAIAGDPRLIAAAASPNTPGDGSVAGLIADLRNAASYVAGDPATDIVGAMDLTTNGTARLMTISAPNGDGSELDLQWLRQHV